VTHLFKWRKFDKDIIILCVRWYLRYALSYRDITEIISERGICVDHSTIYRWVQKYAPILEERCRLHLKKSSGSYRVDEAYIKIKGTWKYLYRAVDKTGQTIDFYLSHTRNWAAATRFFKQALKQPHITEPYVINVDLNAAYPVAIHELQYMGHLSKACKLRQIKYLNNRIESDHRFVKRQCSHKQWFRNYHSAQNTISGYEAMHMIKKGQVKQVAKGNIFAQNKFIENLFGMAA
jgi:transposase-like protein